MLLQCGREIRFGRRKLKGKVGVYCLELCPIGLDV